MDHHNLKIVLILTVGFSLASFLGYLTQRFKLSPLLGYLIAGYFIGPYSPGFVADLEIAEQLAEAGVVLMMFGVGMHFKWQDLMNVKQIAVPGALGQTFVATVAAATFIYLMGWSIESGIVVGLAIGVASTVVLVRVLSDHDLLRTPEGHIAIGWLIVEDILTVIALLFLPKLADYAMGMELSLLELAKMTFFVFLKFGILIVLMLTIGSRIVKEILVLISRTHSHELFTLTVLALNFLIAVGSTYLFGTSIALGAFIAGMVIGQTDVRSRVSTNLLPIRDVFVVLFFISVGMLFDPLAIFENFQLFIGILSIILILKPLSAFLITIGLKYPVKTAMTVALSLTQIGEFSFILAEEAMNLDLLPNAGFDVIVACALISIAINPVLFKLIYLFPKEENPPLEIPKL